MYSHQPGDYSCKTRIAEGRQRTSTPSFRTAFRDFMRFLAADKCIVQVARTASCFSYRDDSAGESLGVTSGEGRAIFDKAVWMKLLALSRRARSISRSWRCISSAGFAVLAPFGCSVVDSIASSRITIIPENTSAELSEWLGCKTRAASASASGFVLTGHSEVSVRK